MEMTSTENSCARAYRTVAGYCLLCVLCVLAGTACSQAEVDPSETEATSEATQSDSKPAGREIVEADVPTLRSIIPPDGVINGGVLNDIAVSMPKPEYPAGTKAEKVSGTVTVEVMVSEKGEVVAASVVSGPQPLWNAAGVAARQARFDPPLKDGKPVKVAGVLTYDFDQ